MIGNTAKPYQSKGLDPYKEDDNILIGLNEFYNGDKTDPVGRRLAYVGGPNSAALKDYKRTGQISAAKLYSYLPNNEETFADYVQKSGGLNKLNNWADQTLNGGNNAQNLDVWADGILNAKTPNTAPVEDVRVDTDLRTGLPIPKGTAPTYPTYNAPLPQGNPAALSPQPETQSVAEQPAVLSPNQSAPTLTLDAYVQGVMDGTIAQTNPLASVAPAQLPIVRKQNQQKKVQPQISPAESDADYRTWLDFKNKYEGANLIDSHETRAQFHNELTSNKNFGSDVEISGDINDPQKSPEQIEAEKKQADAKNFFGSQASIEANSNAEILQKGSAGKVSVDLSQKPPEENAGRFLLREAIKKVAPQYGLTDDEINRFVTNEPLGTNPYDRLSEADIPATLDALKSRKGSTNVDVYVTNANINSILQQRAGADESGVNPILRTEIGLQENTLAGGLSKNQENIAAFRDEDQAREQTRREIEKSISSASFKDKAEQTATNVLSNFNPSSALARFYEYYTGNTGQFADNMLKGDGKLPSADEQMAKIKQEFGSFSEYRKTQDYIANMSAVEYAPRLVAGFGRGFANQVVSSNLKGVDLVDKFVDYVNPLSYLSDEKEGAVRALNYLPVNLRNLENIFGLVYATAIGKGDEFKAATKSADVDRRLLYTVGDRIEKYLGDDQYLSNDFGYKLSQGMGSATGFMFIGMLAPELSVESALGELSLTSGISGSLSQAGDAYGEAKRAGLSEGQAMTVGGLNAPLGLTEMFGVGSTLSRAMSETEKRAFFAFIKENIVHESLEEAVQEFFQTTGGKAVMDAVQDRDPSAWNRLRNAIARLPKQAANTLVNEVPTAALTGGLFGGTVGGAVRLGTRQGSEQESPVSVPTEDGPTINTEPETSFVAPPNTTTAAATEKPIETTPETSFVGRTVELKNVGSRIVREDRGDKVLVSDESGNSIKLVNKTQIKVADDSLNTVAPVPESSVTLQAQIVSTMNSDSPRVATLFTQGETVPPLDEVESQILYDVPITETGETLRLNQEKAKNFFGSESLPNTETINNFIKENG